MNYDSEGHQIEPAQAVHNEIDRLRAELAAERGRAEKAEAALRQIGKSPESCGDDCTSELARQDVIAERDTLRAESERLVKVIEGECNRLSARADNAYCNYINQSRRDKCLGWEIKVKRGEFGRAELDAHCNAAEQLGRHRALHEAVELLRAALKEE